MSGLIRTIYSLVSGKSRVHLDCRTSFKKISPCGIASGIDIGFSNWGLELVTISLLVHIFYLYIILIYRFTIILYYFIYFSRYTMTKSTTIIFILFFAILLKLEKKVCD